MSLGTIASHMDPARLEDLARALDGPGGRPARHEYLATLTPRQRADLTGVRDRLAILVESDVGRWLDPETSGAERLDLLQAVARTRGRLPEPAGRQPARC